MKDYNNSSIDHNSYINGIQNFSEIHLDAISNCLKYGARCIEIDIHESDGDIYVCHAGSINIFNKTKKITTTNKMPIEPYLKLICDFMISTKNTGSTFIILLLEVYIKTISLRQKLSSLIHQYLDNYLLKPTNTPYIQRPLKELIGSIACITLAPDNSYFESFIIDHVYDSTDHSPNLIDSCNSSFITKTRDWSMTSRIYPKPSFTHALSYNFDSKPFFNNKHNYICMNFSSYDSNLLSYLQFFNGQSFKIIQ
jgi:glycerophosphoryl diester phosphodiesterase